MKEWRESIPSTSHKISFSYVFVLWNPVKFVFHPSLKKKKNKLFLSANYVLSWYGFNYSEICFCILSLNMQCKHTESSDLHRKRQNPLFALSDSFSANVKSVFNWKEKKKEMLLEQCLETQSLTSFQTLIIFQENAT